MISLLADVASVKPVWNDHSIRWSLKADGRPQQEE